MRSDLLHVRWRVSTHDLRHGLPRDLAPHLVAALVAGAWVVAPFTGGSPWLAWLGAAVLVFQLVQLARLTARRVAHLRAAERVLTVDATTFVLTDTDGSTVYDAPLVGVEDDGGVLRLEFADGSALEAPWRAFTHATLRRLRLDLRTRMGRPTDLHHVPVRRVGAVTGAGAWRRPRLALLVAVALALLPWLLPHAADLVGHRPGTGGASTVAWGFTGRL